MKAIPLNNLIRRYAERNGLKYWTVKEQIAAKQAFYDHLAKMN